MQRFDLRAICAWILEHLDDQDLSGESLAQAFYYSRFHFHRRFTAHLGLSPSTYIRRARLKRASYQLVFLPDKKIIDIALDAQFENPESFSRCFKNVFGQSPSNFRQSPDWPAWLERYPNQVSFRPLEITDMNVEVVEFPSLMLAVKEHRGPVSELNNSIEQFIAWRKSSGYSPVKASRTMGLAYDDPATTEPEQFRFDICGSVTQAIPEDNDQGVVNKRLEGGLCAHIRHQGSHDFMDDKIRALYSQWLPEQDYELRDEPCFFEYQNFIPEVPEHELITDIYLPIKALD